MTSRPDLIRIEVTDQHGVVAQIIDTGAVLGALPARKRAQLAALAARLVADVASACGFGEDHARQVIVADLARLVADEQAYERVAERRGVLAL